MSEKANLSPFGLLSNGSEGGSADLEFARLFDLPGVPSFWSFGLFASVEQRRQSREERLRPFAKANGIRIDPEGAWYVAALELAADTHPALNKKKRGRPRKFGGLLGSIGGVALSRSDEATQKLILRLDKYNCERRARGEREVSDVGLARLIHAGDTNSRTRSSNTSQLQKRMSAARKRLARPKRVIPKK